MISTPQKSLYLIHWLFDETKRVKIHLEIKDLFTLLHSALSHSLSKKETCGRKYVYIKTNNIFLQDIKHWDAYIFKDIQRLRSELKHWCIKRRSKDNKKCYDRRYVKTSYMVMNLSCKAKDIKMRRTHDVTNNHASKGTVWGKESVLEVVCASAFPQMAVVQRILKLL